MAEGTVGQRLLVKAGVVIEILSHEPKHAALDSAYLELKDAVELMRGRPARETANFTTDGERLVLPATDALAEFEEVPAEAPVAVPASKLDSNGKVAKVKKTTSAKGAKDASGQQSSASSNGDSGAPSGEVKPQ